MDEKQEKKLLAAIKKAVASELHCLQDEYGDFRLEVYPDYDDKISPKLAAKILRSNKPLEAFYEWLSSCEDNGDIFFMKDDLENKIIGTLEDDNINFPNGLTKEEREYVTEFITDHVFYEYSIQQYMNQKLYVNIMMDTGDGLYDYTLNAHYPCWCGAKAGSGIDQRASIVWLANTQGYTKGQLRKALDQGDMSNPSGFLQSMRVEMANMSHQMQVLTFLVRISLETAIKLNTLIKAQERNGQFYDNRKYPDCGYLVLDKKTETGLFNPWIGAGSVFEIELEKDVKVPIKYIRSALPDGEEYGYSVGEVYGMCKSVWRDTVKEIRIPTCLKEEVA